MQNIDKAAEESEYIVGRYRHYKGNEYEVIGEGVHTETEERFVVYRGLYKPYTIWLRPYDMFFSSAIINNEEVPRFTKLSD